MHLFIVADAAAGASDFNSTFYTVAVSIIPVLYLAVAVQGPLYASLMQAALRIFLTYAGGKSPYKKELARANEGIVFRVVVGALAGWTAAGILFFGVVCEVLGLLSLFWERQVVTSWLVLLAAVFLVLVATGGPIANVIKPMFDMIPLLATVKDESMLVLVVPVIVRNGRVLLVRNAATEPGSAWDFPRGKIEIGESVMAAAIRYSFEIAGFPVTPKDYLGQERDQKTGANIDYVHCIPRADDEDEFMNIEKLIPLDSKATAIESAWCSKAELGSTFLHTVFGPVRRYLETTLTP